MTEGSRSRRSSERGAFLGTPARSGRRDIFFFPKAIDRVWGGEGKNNVGEGVDVDCFF